MPKTLLDGKNSKDKGLFSSIKNTMAPSTKKKDLPLPTINIDYPKSNEDVRTGHYTIRLSSQPHAEVQLSFNGSAWHHCRFSVGHWWFDWNPHLIGKYKVEARARFGQGTWVNSDTREGKVVAPAAARPPLKKKA